VEEKEEEASLSSDPITMAGRLRWSNKGFSNESVCLCSSLAFDFRVRWQKRRME
jgi:hypothetical protein